MNLLKSEHGALVWRVCVEMRDCEKSAMVFQIKKRITIDLFIERTSALYILCSRISCMINKGNQPVGLAGWRGKYSSLALKRCENDRLGDTLYRNELNGNVKDVEQFSSKYRKLK